MKLLVTGFPKFDAYAENATEALIESMRAGAPDALCELRDRLIFEIVHFDNDDAETQQQTMLESFHRLIEAHRPDACLFCGQAASRPWITLEAIAVNVFKGKVIDPDGPAAYWATIPEQESLAAAMREAGIPAKLSFHAGTHLCNHILYTALRRADASGVATPCGFLHLPMTNTQVISAEEDRPFIPLEVTRKALSMSIRHIAERVPGEYDT